MPDEIEKSAEVARIVTEVVTESLKRLMPLVTSQRRPPGYNCTGEDFSCDSIYICDNNNHSCKTETSFSCARSFSCIGGPFGIVILRERPR
jgi:hypothetical protein